MWHHGLTDIHSLFLSYLQCQLFYTNDPVSKTAAMPTMFLSFIVIVNFFFVLLLLWFRYMDISPIYATDVTEVSTPPSVTSYPPFLTFCLQFSFLSLRSIYEIEKFLSIIRATNNHLIITNLQRKWVFKYINACWQNGINIIVMQT